MSFQLKHITPIGYINGPVQKTQQQMNASDNVNSPSCM